MCTYHYCITFTSGCSSLPGEGLYIAQNPIKSLEDFNIFREFIKRKHYLDDDFLVTSLTRLD